MPNLQHGQQASSNHLCTLNGQKEAPTISWRQIGNIILIAKSKMTLTVKAALEAADKVMTSSDIFCKVRMEAAQATFRPATSSSSALAYLYAFPWNL